MSFSIIASILSALAASSGGVYTLPGSYRGHEPYRQLGDDGNRLLSCNREWTPRIRVLGDSLATVVIRPSDRERG